MLPLAVFPSPGVEPDVWDLLSFPGAKIRFIGNFRKQGWNIPLFVGVRRSDQTQAAASARSWITFLPVHLLWFPGSAGQNFLLWEPGSLNRHSLEVPLDRPG